MSTFMIKRLILKDWDLLRGTLLLYLAAGAVALGLIAQGSEGAFYAGSILTITILFALGIHIAMATVVGELSLQGIMYFASHEPAIAGTMKGNRIVWSPPAVHMLLGEVAIILLMLGLTFWLQSRKTDFV
jgi:hypothetical protein